MDSGIECGHGPVAPLSRRAGTKAGNVSPPESLRNSRDFRRVMGSGTRTRVGAIMLVRAPGREGPPRVGLVVSSSGGAVTRNRIKRRLRHAIAGIQLQPGTDYVIVANRGVESASFTELEAWLRAGVGEGS
jgi:ribonuclease P protein component